MKIIAENIGKRFIRSWVFRHFTYTFSNESSYAITGSNGTGKSTLLKILAEIDFPSEGTLHSEGLTSNQFNTAFVAPYQELIEELTLEEHLKMHFQLIGSNTTIAEAQDLLALANTKDKQIRFFSSGMKQRVKLALAYFMNSPLLLLDEPTVNLDTKGIDWYLKLMDNVQKDKLVIVCSNQSHEYAFCKEVINISNYHK